MKKLLMLVLLTATISCSKDEDTGGDNNPPPNNNGGNNNDCGTYLGYALYKDTEGCYYNGGNYSKVYVEASNCTCE